MGTSRSTQSTPRKRPEAPVRYSRCLNGQCVTGIDPTSAYYKYYGEFDNGVVKDLPEGVEVEKGSPCLRIEADLVILTRDSDFCFRCSWLW